MADFPNRGATAADVWTYATRNLNSDANNSIRDAVLSDATKIAGQRIADSLVDSAPLEGTLLATGAEDIVVEIDRSLAPKVTKLEGQIDLTNMAGGDTIIVRQYIMIKVAGAYIKYAEETLTGVQSAPLLKVDTNWANRKIKVTLQQTGGVNRNYDYVFYDKTQA